MTRILRSPPFVAATGLAFLWFGAGTLLAVWFSGQIRTWSLMTDELQYAKLALAVGETGSPLPSIHDTTVSVANQLYPLLLAPLYGSLSSTDAFLAAHILNAALMTSAALPAYLLGRQLLPRIWAFAVAVLTIVVPWMVLTGFLMSEVAAYPAFLWAVLAFQRTLVAPSARNDLLAVAGLVAAMLARTQFAALALVLPLAILVHDVGDAFAGPGGGVRKRIVHGVRTSMRRHRGLWASYAVGAIVAAVVSLAGYRLFGAYATTVEGGSVLPSGVWWSAVEHLAVVGIGCGLVPLVLGGGWMLATIGRLGGPGRGFATLSLLTVVALAIETASFDLRFGGEDISRDRYLFYVVPLLLIGSAAALREARRAPVAIGTAVVTCGFAAAAAGLAFPTFPGISLDSPVSILNETLIDQSGALGTGTFVALLGLLLGLSLILGLLLTPRALFAGILFAAVLAFSALTLRAEVNRVLDGTSLTGRPLAAPQGIVLDWVDSVIPEGETAGLVAFPISTAWGFSAIQWWDVEFWNRTITRAFGAPDGNFTYTPFPLRTLEIDPVTGLVDGTSDAPGFVVAAPGDPRFGLAGRVHARNASLLLIGVDRPYRAVWSSRGLHTDGWTVPGRAASVRVYAQPGSRPEVQRVALSLQAPDGAAARYVISTETADRPGAVSAAAVAEEIVLICVAPRLPVDVTVTSTTSTRVEGPPLSPEPEPMRLVGVKLGAISVRPTGRACGEE